MSRAIVAKAADATFEIHTPIADQILRAITRSSTPRPLPPRTAPNVAQVEDAIIGFTDHTCRAFTSFKAIVARVADAFAVFTDHI